MKISEQIIEIVAQMKATNVFPKEIRMMRSVYERLIQEVGSLGSLVLSDSTEVEESKPPEFYGLPITIFEDEHNPYLEFVVTPLGGIMLKWKSVYLAGDWPISPFCTSHSLRLRGVTIKGEPAKRLRRVSSRSVYISKNYVAKVETTPTEKHLCKSQNKKEWDMYQSLSTGKKRNFAKCLSYTTCLIEGVPCSVLVQKRYEGKHRRSDDIMEYKIINKLYDSVGWHFYDLHDENVLYLDNNRWVVVDYGCYRDEVPDCYW